MLYLNVTTHVDDDPDQELLDEKGGSGFPYLVFLDAEGNLLAQHQGQRNVDGFTATMEKAQAYADLRAKAAGGDAAAAKEVLFKDAELGNLKIADAKKALENGKDLSDDEKAKLKATIQGLEMKEVMSGFQKSMKGVDFQDKPVLKKNQAAAGRKFLEMQKAGVTPAEDSNYFQPFYIFIMEAAEEAKDAGSYEAALKVLEDKFGANPNAKKFFDERHATLDKLKGGEEKK